MPSLLRFGLPLLLTSLLATMMHQADRYFLRVFLDMEQVGIYSIAYMIGQGVQRLLLLPFGAIWGVVVYEIGQRSDAKQIYVRVFEYFVYAMGLVLLGASLYAKPLLALLTAPDYVGAADLIPVICLAYLLFSLHTHFNVPVLLAKKTVRLTPASVAAVITNFGLNILLIPRLGPAGAAWASVGTFGVYSFVGLWLYRRIDRYPYPFRKVGGVVLGLTASFVAVRLLHQLSPSTLWIHALAALIWLSWALLLFGGLARQGLQIRRESR